jgi:IS30 family transposase
MARGTYLNKAEYDYIKLLYSQGKNCTEIVKTTGRSEKTVRRAIRTSDFANYNAVNKEERKIRNEREAEQMNMNFDSLQPVHSDEENEALRIRVSFELGETAKKAIDGLLALAGVKL